MATNTRNDTVNALTYGEFAPCDRFQAWSTMPGQGATVTFRFIDAAPEYAADSKKNGFAALTDAQKALTRLAFQEWAAVANLTFVEVSDDGDGGQIRFGRNHIQSAGVLGYSYTPPAAGRDHHINGDAADDIYLNANNAAFTNAEQGNYGYWVYVREIGHSLGLKDPGNYDNDPADGPFLPDAEDHTGNTIMSYNPQNNDAPAEGSYNVGAYDALAVQYLYGSRDPAGTQLGNLRYGDEHAELLIGSFSDANVLWGLGGDDTISGRASDDSIMAGDGDDSIIAGDGDKSTPAMTVTIPFAAVTAPVVLKGVPAPITCSVTIARAILPCIGAPMPA